MDCEHIPFPQNAVEPGKLRCMTKPLLRAVEGKPPQSPIPFLRLHPRHAPPAYSFRSSGPAFARSAAAVPA